MGSCFRLAPSQYDSHPFQTAVKVKAAQCHTVLTSLTIREQKPNIVIERASLLTHSGPLN